MPYVLINPATIRFPQKCPHCGRKAEGTYAIAAMRNLDVFFGDYAVPLLIDLPVCRDALDRRRFVGLVWLIAVLAIILVALFFAVWLAIDREWLPSAVLAIIAVALALGGRTGWDNALLDRSILAANARGVSSKEVRLYFGRDEYYEQWAKLNHVKRT